MSEADFKRIEGAIVWRDKMIAMYATDASSARLKRDALGVSLQLELVANNGPTNYKPRRRGNGKR